MLKQVSFAWAMTPLLVLALSSPQSSLAQTAPSRGPAGFTSGNAPTAASNTTFSVPVTVTAPGATATPVTGNLTVTTGAAGQTPTVSAPPAITQAVAAAGANAVITLSTGTLSQQQVAALVSAVQTLVSSTQATTPGDIVVSTSQGGNTTNSQTFTTLGQALTALATSLAGGATTTGGVATLQVGNVRVSISSAQ